MLDVTLIFDVGKTNKKYFVLDESMNVVEEYAHRWEEVVDEDGYPCDDLARLTEWVNDVYRKVKKTYQNHYLHVNATAYGASFIHLDHENRYIPPLYNYLKPIDSKIEADLHEAFGGSDRWSVETGSPKLGMLNSGIQLLWLKNKKPLKWGKIKYSLHLPNYIMFLLHGKIVSDYTSIGCHTGLWDFSIGNYHRWITDYEVGRVLPNPIPADTTIIVFCT